MAEYTDESKVPDGTYWVTFDNGEEALIWMKNKSLYAPELLAKSTLKRVKGHKPVRFESLHNG